MSAASIRDRISLGIFQGYLTLLEKTVKVTFHLSEAAEGSWGEIRQECSYIGQEQYAGIVGFWHEDSFMMNLVLKEWMEAGQASGDYEKLRCALTQTRPQAGNPSRERTKGIGMDVVVTADKRGDYIEAMLKRYGAHALRVGDGMRMRAGMKQLTGSAMDRSKGLAIALDGPLGPYHEPKKLACFLAEQSGKHFCGVHVHYSCKLRLFSRWDRYVIPLPFTRAKVEVCDFGPISREMLREYSDGKEKIRAVMEAPFDKRGACAKAEARAPRLSEP